MPDHSPDAARTLAALMLAARQAGADDDVRALAALGPDEVAGLMGADRNESLPDDPLGRSLLEHGFSGTITDKLGHKRHYVDGRQVAGHENDGGAGARTSPAADDHAGLAAALKGHPHASRPGFVARVKAKLARAATRVGVLIHEASLRSPQILEAVGALIDTPDDMKKLGYNPATAGTGQHHVADLKDFGPLTTYQAVNLGSMVLAKAYLWAKSKLKGRAESLAGADLDLAAETLHKILSALAEDFGWAEPPPADEIRRRLASA